MDHAKIIRTALRVTKTFPSLWLLGIFLATGFNLQLISYGKLNTSSSFGLEFVSMRQYFEKSGYSELLVLLSLILSFLILLILTNWAKVLLIFRLQTILKLRRATDLLPNKAIGSTRGEARNENTEAPELLTTNDHSFKQLVVKTKTMVMRVIFVSLFTTGVMGLVVIVLSFPFVSFAKGELDQSFMWLSAGLLLVFAVFIVSILSIFASFFIVLLKMNTRSAINLARDLLVAKWHEIAGAVLLFIMAYLASFFVGAYIVASIEHILAKANPQVALIIRNVLLWGWLSVLNVFFYTTMLLLFVEIVRPKMTEEPMTALVTSTAEAQ